MHFYLINIKSIKKEDENHIKTNYTNRYELAKKFVNRDDYLRSIGAFLLLERALGPFKEEEITYSDKGKPSIKNKPYFNYSHSGDFVALVTSKHQEVGIDIQVFNNKDKNYICEWAKKEAVLKLTGEGVGPHSIIPATYKGKKIRVIKKRLNPIYVIYIAYI